MRGPNSYSRHHRPSEISTGGKCPGFSYIWRHLRQMARREGENPTLEISVHDNTLHSYCVSAEEERISLHTSYIDQNLREATDIVFNGVAAYRFELDNFMTIIFDVSEVNVETIYTEDRDLFEQGRKYCWPGAWNSSEEAVLAYLLANDIKGYRLSSSIGMVGWVLAKAMSIVSAEVQPGLSTVTNE